MFDILMPYTVFLLLGELLLIGCWFLGCLLYRALEELWRGRKKKKGRCGGIR